MIIVDTNVIMAFLLTKGITHQVISSHKDVFITPEHCFEEIWRHRDVWNKQGLSNGELDGIIGDVKRLFIYSIPEEVYADNIADASSLINDPDDVPVLALALAIHNEGIWTYDMKHFSTDKIRTRVRILSTSEVVSIYPVNK